MSWSGGRYLFIYLGFAIHFTILSILSSLLSAQIIFEKGKRYKYKKNKTYYFTISSIGIFTNKK